MGANLESGMAAKKRNINRGRRAQDRRKKADRRRQSDRGRRRKAPPERRTVGWVTQRCLQLADDLRSGGVLERTLQRVTRAAEELTRSDQATLRLLDDSGRRMLTSARSGPSVHRRGNTPFRMGEGFLGWVVVHRQPALINSPRRDPRFVNRPGQLWTPGGVMAVPLLTGQACIGVLSVARRVARRYRERDLDLLRLVTQLSAPYLEIARLKRLNDSDPLTLLHNRRHLQDRLPREIQKAQRAGNPLTVAMMDLDRFKRVNDTHGHDVGDEVLLELADRLRHVSRASDVIVRWGGEEFFCIFPATSLSQAAQVADRMRLAVCTEPFTTSAGPLALTISLGVTALAEGDDGQAIERRADRALYRAKNAGRNCVRLDPDAPEQA